MLLTDVTDVAVVTDVTDVTASAPQVWNYLLSIVR